MLPNYSHTIILHTSNRLKDYNGYLPSVNQIIKSIVILKSAGYFQFP